MKVRTNVPGEESPGNEIGLTPSPIWLNPLENRGFRKQLFAGLRLALKTHAELA